MKTLHRPYSARIHRADSWKRSAYALVRLLGVAPLQGRESGLQEGRCPAVWPGPVPAHGGDSHAQRRGRPSGCGGLPRPQVSADDAAFLRDEGHGAGSGAAGDDLRQGAGLAVSISRSGRGGCVAEVPHASHPVRGSTVFALGLGELLILAVLAVVVARIVAVLRRRTSKWGAAKTVSGAAAAVKTCPLCAEEVKVAAKVCKHCGHQFA